jgi:transcriptional regulator with XRE-family HTH domain
LPQAEGEVFFAVPIPGTCGPISRAALIPCSVDAASGGYADDKGVPARLRPQIENPPTRLAALRLRAGVTQEEMAWATGMASASYNRLERGLHLNPPIGWLANSAIVLGCDIDDLIDDEMLEWHWLGQRHDPPPPEWRERDEALERAERWRAHEQDRPSSP